MRRRANGAPRIHHKSGVPGGNHRLIVPDRFHPLLSRGKTALTSRGEAAYLTDGKFQGAALSVAGGAWIALRVGAGPARVFVNWNSPADYWSNKLAASSCPRSNPLVLEYEILRSANSTNGSDGTWTVAASVSDNFVTARGHLIDFEGSSWVKMSVKRGGGTLDEFEVFDASRGAEDTCKASGIGPIPARTLATPPARSGGWQVHDDFLKAVSGLYAATRLAHSAPSSAPSSVAGSTRGIAVRLINGRLSLPAFAAGVAGFHGIDGRRLDWTPFAATDDARRAGPPGPSWSGRAFPVEGKPRRYRGDSLRR